MGEAPRGRIDTASAGAIGNVDHSQGTRRMTREEAIAFLASVGARFDSAEAFARAVRKLMERCK